MRPRIPKNCAMLAAHVWLMKRTYSLAVMPRVVRSFMKCRAYTSMAGGEPDVEP